MALEVIFTGGYLDGERIQFSSSRDYVAGMPTYIRSDGTVDVLTATLEAIPNIFLGLSKEDKLINQGATTQVNDVASSDPINMGIAVGTNQVKMSIGILTTGVLMTPWLLNPSGNSGVWASGQQIFIAADGGTDTDGNPTNGRWNNAATGGNAPRGLVVKAPADANDVMIVNMYR